MNDQLSLQLRSAQPADAPEIARLNALFNGDERPASAYAVQLLGNPGVDTPLLAIFGGRVVGFANLRLLHAFFHPAPYAELTELAVEEAYRRRGIGRALVTYAEQLARAGGAYQMIILTDFYNDRAQGLYRSLGYRHHDIALSKSLRD